MPTASPHHDKETVLRAAEDWGMVALCGVLGIVLKQSGNVWWACCPLHAERVASFKVERRGRHGEWRFKCFGCAEGGGMADLWMKTQGATFPEALAYFASVCNVGPRVEGSAPVRRVVQEVKPVVEKRIVLPRLRKLSDATCEELARLRGLSVEGVMAARDGGLVWGGMFGLAKARKREDGEWFSVGLQWGEKLEWSAGRDAVWSGPHRCWVASDGHKCATVRRLDGEVWPRWSPEDKGFKSYAIGTKKWPMGVLHMGERPCVALVEGEPDLLAAYHFANLCGRLHDVAPVAVLGAASSMPEDIWPRFKGRDIMMFPHYDEVDEKTGKRTGWEAAGKWRDALMSAGARSVGVCWFMTADGERLKMRDGGDVKDLNDAAKGDADTVEMMLEVWKRSWRAPGLRRPWEG